MNHGIWHLLQGKALDRPLLQSTPFPTVGIMSDPMQTHLRKAATKPAMMTRFRKHYGWDTGRRVS